jgi:hypothetical protein
MHVIRGLVQEGDAKKLLFIQVNQRLPLSSTSLRHAKKESRYKNGKQNEHPEANPVIDLAEHPRR